MCYICNKENNNNIMTEQNNTDKGPLIRINLVEDINYYITMHQLAEKSKNGTKPTKKQIVEKMLRTGFNTLNNSK